MNSTKLVRLNSRSCIRPGVYNSIPLGIAIGTFDGMHQGHLKVISCLKEEMSKEGLDLQGSNLGMMSFHPHPRAVLGPKMERRSSPYQKFLTPLSTKLEILSDIQVAYLFLIHFDKNLSELPATDFFEKYILPLDPSVIVVGEDWRFGKNREGDISFLIKHANSCGIKVKPASLENDGLANKIGSTKLREVLSEGLVKEYKLLTNRYYRIRGRVVQGDRRGTSLGFPTANLHLTNQILPKRGVYKTNALIDNTSYPSVTNVGFKPTFHIGEMELRAETHILDFKQDLYGKKISIDFIEYLRDEKKFESKDELIKQIATDTRLARISE